MSNMDVVNDMLAQLRNLAEKLDKEANEYDGGYSDGMSDPTIRGESDDVARLLLAFFDLIA